LTDFCSLPVDQGIYSQFCFLSIAVLQSDCFTAGEKRPFETGAEVVVSEGPPAKTSRVDNVPESRVDLLLSREQMAGNGYPLPYSQSGQMWLTSVQVFQ